MHTAVELKHYQDESEGLLTGEERKEVIDHLAANPSAGDVMKGTGGVRKLRWSRGASGKSGGIRVIYFYRNQDMPLYLLTVYAKGEKDNLSKAQRNDMKRLTTLLVSAWEKRNREKRQ